MYPSKPPQNGANYTSIIHSKTYDFISSDTQSNHTGRAVFITGGSRGIGKAIAISFARAGASYIGIGDISDSANLAEDVRDTAKQAGRSTVPNVLCIHLDISDSESVKAAADQVNETFPRLDVLINNAGFMTPALPITDADETMWWKTFEVNLKGVFLMTKHFTPVLNNTSSGLQTMINVNSVAAHNLRVNASAYGTSKWAVLKFTEFLMVEQAEQGLLAYSVHPGGILTELAKDAMPKDTHAGLADDPAMTGDFIAYITQVKRDWLAGSYISCTWDMEELLKKEKEVRDSDAFKLRLVLP